MWAVMQRRIYYTQIHSVDELKGRLKIEEVGCVMI